MATSPSIVITQLDTGWGATRPDGYQLRFEQVDDTRPGTWKARVSAYAPQDTILTSATIDLENLRDRETYHLSAASMNGQQAVAWDQFLLHSYLEIRAVLAVAQAAEVWPPLEPLPGLLPLVPALPVTMLPSALQVLAGDIAERMQVPLEYVAIPLLVEAGSVIGRQCGILPKQHDDWLVIPNLWGAVIGRPGLMKSPAFTQALKPLDRLAAQAIEEAKEQAAKNAIARDILDAQIAGVKEALKKAAKEGKRDLITSHAATLEDLQAQLEALAVTVRRFKTNDATIQKLGELLRDNPTGLLLYRDELSGWLSSLKQEGREGDREFFLEAWSGDGTYTFDRIGRGMVHVDGLCLSLLGGIQPGKLARYVYDTCEGGTGDDGLLQRFQLLVWPVHDAAFVNVDREPNTQARHDVYALYARLADLDATGLEAAVPAFQTIPAFHFAADAQALFDVWRVTLETRIRAESLQSPAFESHLAKYRSLMPSLALIFYLVQAVMGETVETEVPLQAAQLAAAWCEFLEEHARKVYAGVLQKDLQAAHALAEKLRSGAITTGQTTREIYRNGWALLATAEDVESGLRTLERYHWVRVTEESAGAKGGRPREVIHLHPDLCASP